jgi:hypothetical protein
MRREKLEPVIDSLLSNQLTDRSFLDSLAESWATRDENNGSQAETVRLQSQLTALRAQRERVLDLFVEGVVTREVRDERLAAVDRDLRLYGGLLIREFPVQQPTPEHLAHIFEPFVEWEFLGRDDKRRLLAVTMPEICVTEYRIAGVKLLPSVFGTEVSHTDTGSSLQPA